MRNLRILLVIMLLATTIDSAAQKYLVYTVTGEVTYQKGKSQIRVAAKDKLDATTVVNVPTNARLTLLDEANSQLCTIKTACSGAIKDVVKAKGNSVNKVTSQYVAYLLNKGSADIKKSTKMQSTAASFRDLDSLFFETDSIVNEVPIDTLKEKGHQADSIVEHKGDIGKYVSIKDSLALADTLFQQGYKCSSDSLYKQALGNFERCARLREKYIGLDSIQTSWALSWCGLICYRMQEYKLASNYFIRSWDSGKRHQNIDPIGYLDNIINALYRTKDYKTLIPYVQLKRKYIVATKGANTDENVEMLYDVCNLYTNVHDKENVYLYGDSILIVRANIYGYDSSQYAYSLYHLSKFAGAFDEYEKAIEYLQRSADVYKHVKGGDADYIAVVSEQVKYHQRAGNYAKAYEICNNLLPLVRQQQGEGKEYAFILNEMAICDFYLGNLDKAVELGKQAYLISSKLMGEESKAAIADLNNIATYYSEQGKSIEALGIYEKVIELSRKTNGKDSEEYAKHISNAADCYSDLGNFSKAIKLNKEALEIVEKKGSPVTHARLLYRMSKIMENIRDYQTALSYAEWSDNLNEQYLSKEHPDYLTGKQRIADIYCKLGEYQKAFELDSMLLENVKCLYGESHSLYVDLMNSLSIDYNRLGKKDESFNKAIQVAELWRKHYGVNHSSYATAIQNIGGHYFIDCEYKKALPYFKESRKLRLQNLGRKSNQYILDTQLEATCYIEMRKWNKGLRELEEVFETQQDNILETFSSLNSNERKRFWSNNSTLLLHTFPRLASLSNDKKFCGTAYDGLLLSKGLLLNTELEMKKIIAESGDSALIADYDRLVFNRKVLQKQYETVASKRTINTDSLQKANSRLEEYIADRSKAFGNYQQALKVKWEDVKQQLGEDDIAIEFASYPYEDKIQYAAFILKRNYKSPKVISLFTLKQFQSVSPDNYYTTDSLYYLIWAPVTKQLKHSKNIYISPTGILHGISIENLKMPTGHIMSDKYNIYRISSTRELVLKGTSEIVHSAVLYGGLHYDADTASLNKENYHFVEKEVVATERVATDNLGVRTGANYLEGTKFEIECIGQTLQNDDVDYSVYTGNRGTEESFKHLSSKGINTLHIATHGFYWTEDHARKMRNLNFLQTDNEAADDEDKALTRSGLLLAGANNILSHKAIPDNMEDGVLTAKEISLLDFRGMDMVVLSACQTGLGEVSGEGVFGLQRGFKKAGAKTIVMSLWKVSDEATLLLMSEFYANMGKGMDKHKAFTEAQKYLRTVNDGEFSAPKYWAAFVMLDAI